jgi:hypothetical protein
MGDEDYQDVLALDAVSLNKNCDINHVCTRIAQDYIREGYEILKVGNLNGFRRFNHFLCLHLNFCKRLFHDLCFKAI